MEQSSNENKRKDECGDNEEQTTSKADFNDPSRTSYNVNDLKTIEFNSADAVRQTMKAVLSNKFPRNLEVENRKVQKSHDSKSNSEIPHHETNRGKVTQSKVQKDNSRGQITKQGVKRTRDSGSARKRPGRPPKPGPSKRFKKANVNGFYWGKLSNLIFLSESDESEFTL